MSRDDSSVGGTAQQERVWYLLTVKCMNGHENTIAHKDYWLPPDQSSTWPVTTDRCPTCGVEVSPGDIVEEHEASVVPNPEVPPDER